MMQNLRHANPDITITVDASGSWGCGAFALAFVPIPVALNHNYEFHHITVIELLPIVTATAIWVHTWEFCLDVTTRQLFT